jgi:hypothetical protein
MKNSLIRIHEVRRVRILKRSFSMTENERFGLFSRKLGLQIRAQIHGTGIHTQTHISSTLVQ